MTSTNDELREQWLVETDPAVREELIQQMMASGLFPDDTDYESEYGLYPDLEDPNFIQKLFNKREFGENQTESIEQQMLAIQNGENGPCEGIEFEVTPLQRFVKNFLSGVTPYTSALLYHGVGVGKTCAAIGIAEANLHFSPRKKVYIVAPPNIQPNFERTIFNIDNVSIPKEADIPNTHSGCTGNLYLELTATEYEKDRKVIERKVKQIINTRYTIMGYQQLANDIEKKIKSIPATIKTKEERDIRVKRIIDKEFSNHCMIIDEAHNLRDIPGTEEEDTIDIPGGKNELSDLQQGKKLTRILTKVLDESESMKLVLLTATPMYNSYLEILFLINLLLRNDKRPIINASDIFKDGNFKESGLKLFGNIVKNYISFMRGETPITFPARLKPLSAPRIESWATTSPNRDILNLTEQQRNGLLELPLVPVSFPEPSYSDYVSIFEKAILSNKMSLSSIDTMVQSGNWLYPNEDPSLEDRIRDIGFDNCFKSSSEYSTKNFTRFKSIIEAPTWLLQEELSKYSPKAAFIIKNIRKAEGVIFIYSRFIKSGALPLALALEANGYTPYGRDRTILVDGIQDGKGRQCAKCDKRESDHGGVTDHKLVAAKYILLTGNIGLSPNNEKMIQAERAKTNFEGSDIKVVIGSEVASEGIDLRYIREIYVFDSWYHLNRMEQVLGRGIRTCSHSLLNSQKRNCTVYLMINILNDQRESADMYMYRKAMLKSQQIGHVTRVIKRHALDCNLNIDVNIIKALDNQKQKDSQGNERDVVLDDIGYTNMCDWMECEYKCNESIEIDPKGLDDLTYDDYTAEWRENEVKKIIRNLFETNVGSTGLMMIRLQDITDLLSGVPSESVFSILHDIVNNKSFRIKVNGKEGYITYKNGYYLFQPLKLLDLEIPLALRSADYPIKQDHFRPIKEEKLITRDIEPVESMESKTSLEIFWNEISTWAASIQQGTAGAKVPENVLKAINTKFSNNTNVLNDIKERLEMISWIYYSMHDNDNYRAILSYVFLEFVWDYCLTFSEQIELSKKKENAIIQKVAEEQILKNNVFRYVTTQPPYNIIYWCDTKMCPENIVKQYESDTSDKYLQVKANTTTTGKLYGILIPKKGSAVFSFKLIGIEGKSTLTDESIKSKLGAECKGMTHKQSKLNILYNIGNTLRESGLPEFHLNIKGLVETKGRVPSNTNAYCSLIEFMLRWMDIKKVKGLRWFYRPISTYKSGHMLVKPKK